MTAPQVADQRFMRASDAFSWYMEEDPVLRSTVVAIAWLDRTPDWPTLAARMERATRQAPMFRQRVLDLPGRLTPPRWTDVSDFDLSWHLTRVRADEPGDDSFVMDFARREAMTGFDRMHPLWRLTLIESLPGGAAALVMKIHHSLTDGIGGVQLARLVFDVEREPGSPVRPAPVPPPPVEPVPSAAGLLAERIGWRVSRSFGALSRQAGALIPGLVSAARRPLPAAAAAGRGVASIARTVAPVRRTLSPLMTGRSLKRQLASLSVPLAELKAASAAAGGSLNDGFLGAVTGGLRIYHERHGVAVEHLRVTMPVSLRTEADPAGGNRMTLMRFAVPVGERHPARRVAEVRRATMQARQEPSLGVTDAIAGALNLLPAGFIGSMLRNVDFVASDVPGFNRPVYLAGARVERYEAYGPTTGTAVNVTLLSYDGRCYVGVTLDCLAVPDTGMFMDCLAAGFEEMLSLGRPVPPSGSLNRPARPRSDGRRPAAGLRSGNTAGRHQVATDAGSDSRKGGGSAG
jgi:WS/DGAT/MGAT family acyltransferase